jgi:hypothetical protein
MAMLLSARDGLPGRATARPGVLPAAILSATPRPDPAKPPRQSCRQRIDFDNPAGYRFIVFYKYLKQFKSAALRRTTCAIHTL